MCQPLLNLSFILGAVLFVIVLPMPTLGIFTIIILYKLCTYKSKLLANLLIN